MARASTPTLLSLDRFARLMGIGGPYFNQACVSDTGTPWHVRGSCTDIWFQYPWQNVDAVSREDLAEEIGRAEDDLAEVVRYPLAPTYVTDDVQLYPRPYGRDMVGYGGQNVRGYGKSVQANWGRVIAPGQRGTTFVSDIRPAYLDLADAAHPAGDGFWETARLTIPLTDAQHAMGNCAVKVYYSGYGSGAPMPEWEIRPWRKATWTSPNLVLDFDSWLFINPDYWEDYPDEAGPRCVDISGDPTIHGKFVADVEVYLEYCDTSAVSATYIWEPLPALGFALSSAGLCCCGLASCPACALTEQDGCFHIRDWETGIVVPIVATYSAASGQWGESALTACREPDMVRLYYLAGDQDTRYMKSQVCDPLSDKWAKAVAYMAAARVKRPFCSCGNVEALNSWLRQDLAAVSSQERQSQSYQMSLSDLDNPFGTRQGELYAWRLVKKMPRNMQITSAVI